MVSSLVKFKHLEILLLFWQGDLHISLYVEWSAAELDSTTIHDRHQLPMRRAYIVIESAK